MKTHVMVSRFCLSIFLFFSMGIHTGHSADCDADIKAGCASNTTWYDAKRARLGLREQDVADYSDWLFTIPDPLNLSVQIDQKHGDETTSGTVMLVSGRLMMTKGLDMNPGYEIDLLDGPILIYQLAINLLDKAFPTGPATIVAEHGVDRTEEAEGIHVATMSASGQFQPPWTLTGKVSRASDESISFDLAFTFPAGGENRTWHLSGLWENPVVVPDFDDSMSLEEWNIHSLGPISIKRDGGSIVDYGAEKIVLDIKTLRQLKDYVQAQEKRPD